MDAKRLLAAHAALADDDRRGHGPALRTVLHVLELHAARLNGWFAEQGAALAPHPRAALLRRVLERVPSLERWVRAGVAVARATSAEDVELEWGPLLDAAFPARDGVLRSAAHKRLVFALLDNPALDDAVLLPRLAAVGLPQARAACVSQLGHRPFGNA